jgi:hypothetical protein
MTRPKKDSDSLRIIVDLSYPEGQSVNDGIPTSNPTTEKQFTLPTIATLIKKVQNHGQCCWLWKSDLSRAYRQLRLDPTDYPLLGIKHRNSYYIDITPSFGCRTSASACQQTTQAICDILNSKGHDVIVYIDDFAGIAPTETQATSSFQAIKALTTELGVKLAPDKTVPPSTNLDFLGFNICTIEKETTPINSRKIKPCLILHPGRP